MLAIIRCRIFCLLGCYPKKKMQIKMTTIRTRINTGGAKNNGELLDQMDDEDLEDF